MNKPDAIQILVNNQAKALIDHGVPVEAAFAEAEDRVAQVLHELEHLGLAGSYIGLALRRAHVYQLRNAGLTVRVVGQRLGIGTTAVKRDYKAEMLRRRELAS